MSNFEHTRDTNVYMHNCQCHMKYIPDVVQIEE